MEETSERSDVKRYLHVKYERKTTCWIQQPLSNATHDAQMHASVNVFRPNQKKFFPIHRKSRNQGEKRRRDQFNLIVDELNSMVSPTNQKLDKSTVLKATIAFLKQRNGKLLTTIKYYRLLIQFYSFLFCGHCGFFEKKSCIYRYGQ